MISFLPFVLFYISAPCFQSILWRRWKIPEKTHTGKLMHVTWVVSESNKPYLLKMYFPLSIRIYLFSFLSSRGIYES